MRWLTEEPSNGAPYVDGVNLYSAFNSDPIVFVDSTGCDTYTLNRELGGDTVSSNFNIFSHTFTYTTNPDGTLAHTYSWGNKSGEMEWHKDEPEDIKAAQEAIASGYYGWHGGDSTLDPYIQQAWEEFVDSPWHYHINLVVLNNCKQETMFLINEAKDKRMEDIEKTGQELANKIKQLPSYIPSCPSRPLSQGPPSWTDASEPAPIVPVYPIVNTPYDLHPNPNPNIIVPLDY